MQIQLTSTDILYHGSNREVKVPDLLKAKRETDFGAGFYLTKDERMAKKWAAGKLTSIYNAYNIKTDDLKLHYFKLDTEWLDFVRDNRLSIENHKYDEYDVLIGPTADDMLFDTLRDYLNDTITSYETIRLMSALKYSEQIVLKTDKAVSRLTFLWSKELTGKEKLDYKKMHRADSSVSVEKTLELRRQMAREREAVMIRLAAQDHMPPEGSIRTSDSQQKEEL